MSTWNLSKQRNWCGSAVQGEGLGADVLNMEISCLGGSPGVAAYGAGQAEVWLEVLQLHGSSHSFPLP